MHVNKHVYVLEALAGGPEAPNVSLGRRLPTGYLLLGICGRPKVVDWELGSGVWEGWLHACHYQGTAALHLLAGDVKPDPRWRRDVMARAARRW